MKQATQQQAEAEQIGVVADELLGLLKSRDREAILLRYYQGKSFVEMARRCTSARMPPASALTGRWRSCDSDSRARRHSRVGGAGQRPRDHDIGARACDCAC